MPPKPHETPPFHPRPGFKNLNQVQIFSTAYKNGTTPQTLNLLCTHLVYPAGPGRRRVCRRDLSTESPLKRLLHAPTCAHAMLRAIWRAYCNLCVTSDFGIRHKPKSVSRSLLQTTQRGTRRPNPGGRTSAHSVRRPRRGEIVSATNCSFLQLRFVFGMFVAEIF